MFSIALVLSKCLHCQQILDVVDTFSDEVRGHEPSRQFRNVDVRIPQVALMWPSRFTVMKVIYFVNRYLPLIEIALSVICEYDAVLCYRARIP